MGEDNIKRLEFKIDLVLKMLLDLRGEHYISNYIDMDTNWSFDLIKNKYIDDILKILNFEDNTELKESVINMFSNIDWGGRDWWEKGIKLMFDSNDPILQQGVWNAIQYSIEQKSYLPGFLFSKLQSLIKEGSDFEKEQCLKLYNKRVDFVTNKNLYTNLFKWRRFERDRNLKYLKQLEISQDRLIEFFKLPKETLRAHSLKAILKIIKNWPREHSYNRRKFKDGDNYVKLIKEVLKLLNDSSQIVLDLIIPELRDLIFDSKTPIEPLLSHKNDKVRLKVVELYLTNPQIVNRTRFLDKDPDVSILTKLIPDPSPPIAKMVKEYIESLQKRSKSPPNDW